MRTKTQEERLKQYWKQHAYMTAWFARVCRVSPERAAELARLQLYNR